MAIPLTIRCECGETHSVQLGETVTCSCGRRYDTSTLPSERFAHIRAKQARVRLYMRIGTIFIAAAVVASALLWGLRGVALALPLACLLWFLFFGKWARRRWLADAYEPTTMKLEASNE